MLKTVTKNKTTLFWVLYALISLYHLYIIAKTSVNVPFMDEWELFHPNSFFLEPNLHNLFKQHNEHILVLPNLIFLFFKWLNGFNILTLQVFNYIFYSLITLLIIYFIKSSTKSRIVLFSSLVLLSPLNFENHSWPFQIQWHLMAFFSILSYYLFFIKKENMAFLVLSILLPFCIVYSLGAGLAVVSTQIAFFALVTLFDKSRLSKLDILYNIFYIFFSMFVIWFYFMNYQKPASHPEIIFPYSGEFWKHFLSQLSLGVNSNSPNQIILGIIPLFLIYKNTQFVLKKWSLISQLDKFIYGLSISFLGILMIISLSRAGFGFNQALASRYFEYSAILFLIALAQSYSLYTLKKRYLFIINFILFYNMTFNFDFFTLYNSLRIERLKGQTCLTKMINDDEGQICKELYPGEIKGVIKGLKDSNLKLSFMEELKTK
ncbi:MAG: hypothetical protein J0M15_07590 [Deltaproteobacteria bacterium]|nr:hypothetical protein [Deltaproteobacteria bacterium]